MARKRPTAQKPATRSSADRNTYGNHITITPKEFGPVIQSLLNEYEEKVQEAFNDAVKVVSKGSANETRFAGSYQNRRPKYRRSISYRFNTKGYYAQGQVYARGHEYSLTHLLEDGHKLWNAPGKRTRAFIHWKAGERFAIEMIVPEILKRLNL